MITCSQCRWWGKPIEGVQPVQGRCGLYGHFQEAFPILKVHVPGDDSSMLYTEPDFGCVQGEGGLKG